MPNYYPAPLDHLSDEELERLAWKGPRIERGGWRKV